MAMLSAALSLILFLNAAPTSARDAAVEAAREADVKEAVKATAGTASPDEEVVEDVEEVQLVDVGNTAESDRSALSLSQIVGRNHAALVHLPLGFLIALGLVEVVRLLRKKSSVEGCGLLLQAAAVLSFLPAALSGWLRANELFSNNPAPHEFFEHRNLMFAASAFAIAALVLRMFKKNLLTGKFQAAYLLLLAVALSLAVIGAHHGGMLVYGEHFLPY